MFSWKPWSLVHILGSASLLVRSVFISDRKCSCGGHLGFIDLSKSILYLVLPWNLVYRFGFFASIGHFESLHHTRGICLLAQYFPPTHCTGRKVTLGHNSITTRWSSHNVENFSNFSISPCRYYFFSINCIAISSLRSEKNIIEELVFQRANDMALLCA